jgi:hypothetical protein
MTERVRMSSNEGSSLTKEQLREINWVVFSREKGAPFNLSVLLDPDVFNPDCNDGLEKRTGLFGDLLDPSKLVPFYRWQLCRRVINPLYDKGSGFEGHLIGLPLEEIKKTLSEQEKFLKRNGCQQDFQKPTSLEEAIKMSECFAMILARMRAIRTILQKTYSENQEYQDMVYISSNQLLKLSFNINKDNLIIGVDYPSSLDKNYSSLDKKGIFSRPFNDIGNYFPLLAEIGRFGFPPLRTLLYHLSLNHLI